MGTAAPVPWATLALTAEKAIVIPHHAAMEQPAYLSLKATNVSVTTDSQDPIVILTSTSVCPAHAATMQRA